MLEQIAYEVQRVSEERQTNYFTVGDLESLSASALYTGHLPKAGPGGFALTPVGERMALPDIPMYGVGNNPIFFPADVPKVANPIGTISGFKTEGLRNISQYPDLSKILPEAKDYSLTERYDTSHGQFHLNQDIVSFEEIMESVNRVVNSGTSEKNEDEYKGLGSAHNIKLFSVD